DLNREGVQAAWLLDVQPRDGAPGGCLRIDRDRMRKACRTLVACCVDSLGMKLMCGALHPCTCRKRPVSQRIGCSLANELLAVVYLHRGIGFGRALQGQAVVVAVATIAYRTCGQPLVVHYPQCRR